MSKSTDPAHSYVSNPFPLAFDALGRLFKTNVGWAVVLIIVGFFGTMFQAISSLGDTLTTETIPSSSHSSVATTSSSTDTLLVLLVIGFVFLFVCIFIVIAALINTYLVGMFTYVTVQSEQGKSVSFSEAFEAVSKRFWRLFGGILLANIKIFGWTLLFIIPGIVAALRYSLLPYLIMDESAEKKSIKEAHDTTKAVVKGRLFEVFGVGTVAAIIPFVGTIIGLTGRGALYRQLRHYHDKNLEKPAVHWLNYIGLALIAFVVLSLSLLILIVVIAVAPLP